MTIAGLDAEFSNGKVQYTLMAAAITLAIGSTLPDPTISGSNTTSTSCLLSRDDIPCQSFAHFMCDLYI